MSFRLVTLAAVVPLLTSCFSTEVPVRHICQADGVGAVSTGTSSTPPPVDIELLFQPEDLTANQNTSFTVNVNVNSLLDEALVEELKAGIRVTSMGAGQAQFTLGEVSFESRIPKWTQFAVRVTTDAPGWYFVGYPQLPAWLTETPPAIEGSGVGTRVHVGPALTPVAVKVCASTPGAQRVTVAFNETVELQNPAGVVVTAGQGTCTLSSATGAAKELVFECPEATAFTVRAEGDQLNVYQEPSVKMRLVDGGAVLQRSFSTGAGCSAQADCAVWRAQ